MKPQSIASALSSASESELATLFESIALQSVRHGITITRSDGRDRPIIYCNQGFIRLSGYELADIVGHDCRFMQGPETDPGEVRRLSQALAAGKACVVTLRNYRKNGEPFWNRISVSPIPDENTRNHYFVGVQEDVTAFIEAESHEHQLDTILEHSLNEIYTFSPHDLQFLKVNHGARKNLGYTSSELVTMTPVDIKPEFDIGTFRQLIAPLANDPQRSKIFTTIHQRKDGSTYPVEVHLQLIEARTCPVYAAVVLDITRRTQDETQLRESHDDLRALSARLQTIRDDERRHLSRELHDDVGQLLSAARMELSLLARALPDQTGELFKRVSALDSLIDRTVLSIRSMVKDLRPRALENAGLFGGIELLAQEIGRRHALQISFRVDGDMETVPDSLVTPLYRLIQESLNNVARHAQADSVSILLDRTEQALTLRVHDDGIGFTPEQANKSSSFGLAGMRERVEILGGSFSVTGKPGKGTEVVAVFPFRSLRSETSRQRR